MERKKGELMFQILWEEPIITVAILVFWGISLFVRILLGSLYRSMIKQSDNMATTNNRLLKQCKLKFANCYQLNSGVSNIPVFVDKFLNRLTLGPFSFETLYHLSGQSMLLSVIFSGVGVVRAILRGRTLGEILPFYIVSFLGLYLYFSVSSLVDLKGKKRILKVNLVDYLENHLSARIGVTEQDMKMLYGRKRSLELLPIGTRSTVVVENATGKTVENAAEKAAAEKPVAGKITAEAFGEGSDESAQPVSAQSVDQASPFYISEEELEALIKEFC